MSIGPCPKCVRRRYGKASAWCEDTPCFCECHDENPKHDMTVKQAAAYDALSARVTELESQLDQTISTVIEYYEAAQALNTYEPESIRICDPIDQELTRRFETVVPAFWALVRERKVPSRDIAAENAALRVFVIDLKRTMKKLLADAPEVPPNQPEAARGEDR